MPILRLLFLILLLLNLLALAASTGLLTMDEPRGEPERLTNQLNPERLRLVNGRDVPPPAAAPAETTAPAAQPDNQACIAFDGLGNDTADEVVHRFDAPAFTVRREGAEAIISWWVRIPPDGTREFAERKARELRGLNVTDYYVVVEAGPNQYAVSLGLFKSENAANQHLERLRARGVRSAGIEPRRATLHHVEVRGAREAVDARLAGLPAAAKAGPCSTP
ncbi:SPOR domain-containing protein [Pseudothauera rhizosphaerae]|uniref:SPOR domain-containing protein n=1 Tax=Pseudothauera rhizosphaerae TaxID=2565932 RepID=A0A4S4ANM3_9RHOO|nr:SPOR domain-containing protein [Pseudothauera rhizosphaerae]THF61256.1 SPOR domain-containing protein [Pseudothauera rhizosphaerae]